MLSRALPLSGGYSRSCGRFIYLYLFDIREQFYIIAFTLRLDGFYRQRLPGQNAVVTVVVPSPALLPGTCFHFYRAKGSAFLLFSFSMLVDLHRIVLTHALRAFRSSICFLSKEKSLRQEQNMRSLRLDPTNSILVGMRFTQ